MGRQSFMSTGVLLSLREDDESHLRFAYDGRPWAAVTALFAVGAGAIAREGLLAQQPAVLIASGLFALMAVVGTFVNLTSAQTLEIDRTSGRVSCRGSWTTRRIEWTRPAEDFEEVRIVRVELRSGMHLELVPKRGAPVNLRTRGFIEMRRAAVVRDLAQRVADALRIPVSDRS
jgi:hypothetical protein